MSFDYAYAYEDRTCIHTSRWSLSGIDTRENGNTIKGRLWMLTERNGDVVDVELYKTPDCDSSDLVASGEADFTGLAAEAARCAFSPENDSGIWGEMWVESQRAGIDCGYPVEVLVSLCTDVDLALEYCNLEDLPSGVYSAETGMARHCAAATEKTLLLAAQLFAGQLGGCGAPEHRYRTAVERDTPDYRRLVNPDQLKEAAVHWALAAAFGSCHELSGATVYSELRDHHDRKRREAVGRWNLAFNLDPDTDEDADARASSTMVRTTRL